MLWEVARELGDGAVLEVGPGDADDSLRFVTGTDTASRRFEFGKAGLC